MAKDYLKDMEQLDINHFLNEDIVLTPNYLAKTGWSHGDQEIFSIDELISLFSLDRITKSAAAFDIENSTGLISIILKMIVSKIFQNKYFLFYHLLSYLMHP